MAVLQLETTIGSRETSVGAEVRQGRDKALVDVERGELVQLLEEVRSFRHYLREQRNDLRGALPHQRPELGAAEKHGFRFFRCACIRDVVAIRSKSFTTESLTSRGDHGNKAAPDFDLVAQDDVSLENDEDAIRHGATLIQLKSGRPGGSRAISTYGCYFFRSET